ncbi:MAG: hypothetical protein AB8B87_06635 [Granulosicoccus sp.]
MNEIVIKAVSSGRTAYPVVPDPDNPIILQIDGRLMRVLDISASGFTLPADVIASGRRYPFSMDLPTAGRSIGGYVDVLPSDDDEPLQCRFVNLLAEEQDALHQYALIRQKDAIRSLRTAASGDPY